MGALGVSLGRDETRVLVEALDTSGDGEISLDELARRLECKYLM